MKKNTRNSYIIIIVVLCACLLFSSTSFAGVVFVDRVRSDFLDMSNPWYTYNSGSNTGALDFSSVNFALGGGFYAGGANKGISNFDLTFHSNLQGDPTSGSGSIAQATFQGGVTVSLSATVGTYSGVLLEGTIVESSFVLTELATDKGEFNQQVNIDLNDSVGLAAGIDIGDGNIYKMLNPQMDMFLRASVNPNNFAQSFKTGVIAASIDFVAVPEPATLLLLGLGGILLRRKK